MRFIFTLTILAFFSFTHILKAQVLNKGDKLFGGSLSFSFYNNNNGGAFNNGAGNVGLFPSFGWAVKDNCILGVRGAVSYTRSETRNIPFGNRIVTSFSFGPGVFLKKYKILKNKFGLYFDHSANVNYMKNKEKYTPVNLITKTWAISYGLSPGVFYKFSDSFFGEANIGGVNASFTTYGNTKNYSLGASFLQYFNLGINFRIPRRKS